MVNKKGGYVNGIYTELIYVREMLPGLIAWKQEYTHRYDHFKRMPANVNRYIKSIDVKINDMEKIMEKYGK